MAQRDGSGGRAAVPIRGRVEQLARDLVLGGVSGAVAKTAMAPVERIKLLLQTQDSNPKILNGEVKPYSSIVDCARRVRAEQGIAAFWRGNLVNVLRYAPQQGSALAFNDAINNAMPQFDANNDFWKSFAVKLTSGGVAGALANTMAYPFDFARTRLASDVHAGKGHFNGIWDCISKTVRSQGITGLYTGWAVTCAGAFIYRAGQLGTFKQIMELNPYKNDNGPVGIVAAFVAATVARTAVMPFNYPADTLRRRLMLESEKPRDQRKYKGAMDCMRQIVRSEGVRGLYKGMVPELFRGVGGSLVIVAFDRIKRILDA